MLHTEGERATLRRVEGDTELPGGEDVKSAVQKITEHRRSLFSYAIISGQSKAVESIYRLVAGWEEKIENTYVHHVGIFGDDHELVREVIVLTSKCKC